ncbi:MAG: hypothetical protein IPO52_00270 [Gemmatimonadetes bacterium]|nr:hypothetical protein [Gemmatimonadota bacterium]
MIPVLISDFAMSDEPLWLVLAGAAVGTWLGLRLGRREGAPRGIRWRDGTDQITYHEGVLGDHAGWVATTLAVQELLRDFVKRVDQKDRDAAWERWRAHRSLASLLTAFEAKRDSTGLLRFSEMELCERLALLVAIGARLAEPPAEGSRRPRGSGARRRHRRVPRSTARGTGVTSPLQPRSHDPALATAVETTLAETQAKPSRMPSLRTWLRGIGAVWILVATVNGTARTSAGFYVGFALFGAAMLGLAGVMKLRAGEKGPGWRIGIATTGVLAGLIATGVGLLSVPWATGALAVGALLGWWGARLETVGESLPGRQGVTICATATPAAPLTRPKGWQSS